MLSDDLKLRCTIDVQIQQGHGEKSSEPKCFIGTQEPWTESESTGLYLLSYLEVFIKD